MTLVAAVAVHALAAAAILVEVKKDDAPKETDVPVMFYRPSAPAPPPPPPPAAARRPRTTPKSRPTIVAPVIEQVKPLEVPPEVEPPKVEEPPAKDEEDVPEGAAEGGQPGGVEGGVAGGQTGGKVGGEVGGTGDGSGDEPVRMRRGMTPPRPLEEAMVEPEYPRMMREARISGRVLLLIEVRRDGTVGEVKIQSGHPLLAEQAARAVRKWRFIPAEFEGRPIAIWLPYPFVFKID